MEEQRKVLTGAQFFLYRNLGFRTRSDSVRTRLGLGPKSVCPKGCHKSIMFFVDFVRTPIGLSRIRREREQPIVNFRFSDSHTVWPL